MTDFAAHEHRADGRVTADSTTPRERGRRAPAGRPGSGQRAGPSRPAPESQRSSAARRADLRSPKLVARVGDLHHNAIRNHLRILAQAGLVAVERNPPSGRGRPTERFVLVDPEVSRITAQQALVQLLVTMLVDAGVDHDRARAFGEAHASLIVSGARREQLIGSLARFGFAPHETTSVKDAASGVLELRLDHCPFADAVLAPGGTIVCALHRGLLDGAATTAQSPVTITEFEVRHPHDAGCIVRFEGIAPVPTGAPTWARHGQ